MHEIDQLLDEQQRFYSEKSEEYVDWITRYMDPVRPDIERLVRSGPLTGSVLEFAPGTGYWTETLADVAHDVTCVDGSAEMLDIVARRGLPNVTLVQSDLFSWKPTRTWDAVFFVHWLAHVPVDKLPGFFKTVDEALRPGGRVVFVDVTEAERRIEENVRYEASVPVITRKLDDGRTFTVIKKYWDPDDLLQELSGLGWSGTATPVAADRDRGFIYYELERTSDR